MVFAYRVVGYLGLLSVLGALLFGFRHDPGAPWSNYLFNIGLYLAWALVHLLMTSDTFKRIVYGARTGSLIERQVYIMVTVITWLGVLWLHRAVPGPSHVFSEPIRFTATIGFLFGVVGFFEGATFASLDGFLGVPGATLSHAHSPETPLLTGGQYAQVRHPMYRAATGAAVCTLFLHCHLSQLLWSLLIGATFIFFIPIEEGRLIAARGDAYRAYMQAVPWRLLRGVW